MEDQKLTSTRSSATSLQKTRTGLIGRGLFIASEWLLLTSWGKLCRASQQGRLVYCLSFVPCNDSWRRPAIQRFYCPVAILNFSRHVQSFEGKLLSSFPQQLVGGGTCCWGQCMHCSSYPIRRGPEHCKNGLYVVSLLHERATRLRHGPHNGSDVRFIFQSQMALSVNPTLSSGMNLVLSKFHRLHVILSSEKWIY